MTRRPPTRPAVIRAFATAVARVARAARAGWAHACFLGVLHLAMTPAHAADEASGRDTRAQAPVAIGSPAWEALMDLPLRDGDALQLPAVTLLRDWRRPDLADRLQAALLLAQWRMAAGLQPVPDASSRVPRVRDAWRPEDPPVDVDDLQDAWQAALVRGLAVTPASTPPPPLGTAEPVAVPGVPGFWRVDEAGHVSVMARVANHSPMRLAPGESEARVRWTGVPKAVDLRCAVLARPAAIAPGRDAPLNCVGQDLPAGARGWPSQWQWLTPSLVTPADRDAIAALHGARNSSASLSVAAANARCDRQGNCSEAQRTALRHDAAAASQAAAARWAETRARDEEATRARRDHDRREKRRKGLLAMALVLIGQVVYVILARLTGSTWPPTIGVMGLAGFAAFAFAREASTASTDSFLPLVLVMLAAWAVMGGVLLSVLYAWVYRTFFSR